MAEDSSFDSSASYVPDLSYEKEILGSGFLTGEICELSHELHNSILDEDYSDRLLHLAKKLSSVPILDDSKSQEDDDLHQPYMEFGPEDNIKPSFYENTTINEDGIFEINIKELERKLCLQSLKEVIEDDPPQKNKFWDRTPHLRELDRDYLLHKFQEVTPSVPVHTEEDSETYSKGLDSNPALNILRRIAYPKLGEKHFSSEFPSGALFIEEDEPDENISIDVDHFEFWHEELKGNIWKLFEQEDIDWEKNTQINNLVPLFIKFLDSDKEFQFLENCFSLILAILKNPYRKIEVFYDFELPVVKEQAAIAKYLMKCLQISEILDKNAYEKLAEAIIRFADIHPSFLAYILERFNVLLSIQIDDELAYQIYCRVLNLMTSIGATIIDLCLPQHFEKISRLTANDQNCDLYFNLLKACEISITNTIEHESWVKAESSDEVDLYLFYFACYNYFGWDLTTHLIPVFKKYENRKNREEQYLSKKHAIFPTENGYMNMEIEFLINRGKNRAESEFSSLPEIKKCIFNSADKVLFSSSNPQLGYVIQKDMCQLSSEDIAYWTTIDEFALSCLENVKD